MSQASKMFHTAILCVAVIFGAFGHSVGIASADDAADKKPKKIRVATFVLKDDLPEGAAAAGLFDEIKPRLREVCDRIESAAKDDKIAAIVLVIRSPKVGLGKVHELRAAIARARQAGKTVYADLTSGQSKDYLVAAACDEIVMPPSGSLMVTGTRIEVTFFKGLLDKLGVRADLIQVGSFKGAAEPFVRTEMSPEFRKQFEAVIDSYYEQLADTIAADRKVPAEKVKQLIDEGLFTAEQAKTAGLVDHIWYEDEFRDHLQQKFEATEITFDKEYGKKKIDTDFSGITGFMKLLELMMGGEGTTKSSKNPKIALVYAVGAIMDGESSSGLFGAGTLGGDTLVKALRKAQDDPQVKAIVLRVDSPGGSALASDLVWREITRSKKPVVASMGDTAASGGYYISMGASKIFVEPGTLTGSIGVVGGKVALKGLMNKVGISTEVISRGKNSGSLSPIEPFTDGERDAWKRLMLATYKDFTGKAAAGRKMEVAKLEGLAQGRLFTGKMAVENGLADTVGTLSEAIAAAKSMAGLKAEDKTDLEILPKPKSFFEDLFGGSSLEAQAKIVAPELLETMETVENLRRLFARPAVTVLPFQIEIN